MEKNKKSTKKEKTRKNLKSLIFGGSANQITFVEKFPNGTEGFVPVMGFQKGVIITKDGRYVKILEVPPINFYLKSDIEQQNIIHFFASYLKIAPPNLQILIRTQRADIDTYCQQMEQFYENEQNEDCRDMILQNAEMVNHLASNEAVSRNFYLVYEYEGTTADFDEIAKELAEQAIVAQQYLSACGLEVLEHEDYNSFQVKTLYSILNKKTFRASNINNWKQYLSPVFGNDDIQKEDLSEEEKDGMLSLADLLSPTDCDLTQKEYVKIDGVYHTYLYITGYSYPTDMALAWLSPLVELGDGISVNFQLSRKRKEVIVPKISKTTMFNRTRMRDVGDTRSDFEELDDAIASGMYLKEGINRNNEDFYYIHTLIEVIADDKETLELRIKEVNNLCSSLDLICRRADYKHEQCFYSMLPLCKLDDDIERKTKRNALTTSVACAFPFSSFELCDSQGIFLGINRHNSSAVIMDNFDSDKYSNANIALFGMSGAGKTYTLLLMALRFRMQGTKVIMIIPEKGFEYRPACNAIGGQFVNLAFGSQDCLNIMEIRRKTLDIDDDLDGGARRYDSVLLDKIQQMHTYFSLACEDMTQAQHHFLDIALFETYAQFTITRDNESLINDKGQMKPMPDLRDLYQNLVNYDELKEVALTTKRLIDAGLGGQTNISLDSGFTVMDVSKMPKEFSALGMYTATSFTRDEISVSRIEKVVVVMDEGWKIAGNRDNDEAADFVLELVKILRGFAGSFISATQNCIDYFALQNGRFGKSLLNNSRFKILLQMEEAEALEMQDKLGLSDEETMQITRSGRGQGLFCAGPNRFGIEIRASEKEHSIITTSRVDLEKRKAIGKGG